LIAWAADAGATPSLTGSSLSEMMVVVLATASIVGGKAGLLATVASEQLVAEHE
jgi:hypothetical protein